MNINFTGETRLIPWINPLSGKRRTDSAVRGRRMVDSSVADGQAALVLEILIIQSRTEGKSRSTFSDVRPIENRNRLAFYLPARRQLMFGLGFTEILVILVVALIFLGPEKLPEAAKMIGKTLGEFRRAVDEIRFDITSSDYRSSPPTRRQEPNSGLIPGALGSESSASTQVTANEPTIEATKPDAIPSTDNESESK